MRIISGEFKGRRITAPKKLPVRPTTDMAKESLFNILNNRYYFDEISVLDLFAGTGNLSYEFASRGCEQITAVDQDYGCIKFINETAESFGMTINTIKSDVFKFLEHAQGSHTVIFADPPYELPKEEFAKIARLIFENSLLKEEGILVIEHSKHTDLSDLQHYLKSKSYGGNSFSFFEIATEEEEEEETN
jgi:16S rRNA (guanine(966)-N(2))-methyltransferase RsmD